MAGSVGLRHSVREEYVFQRTVDGPASRGDPAIGPSRVQAIAGWRNLRVGLFIHWSPSSGRALPQSHSHARQSALNPHGSVPAEVYDAFCREFNPVDYDPDAWLRLAHAAGMRYAVFVAKHHDGFCMFDSQASGYNIMATPYGRDVAMMFAEACRHQGLAWAGRSHPRTGSTRTSRRRTRRATTSSTGQSWMSCPRSTDRWP